MKLLNKAVIGVLLASVMTMSAQAAVSYTNGQAYVGAKVGQYDPKSTDEYLDNLGDATSYGVYGGYNFGSGFGIEAEYLRTNTQTEVDTPLEKFEYDAAVYGVYGKYDYIFPNTNLYAKGRLGVAKHKLHGDYTDKVDASFNGTADVSETGVAGGIGLGYNVTPMASVEAMYNVYPDVDTPDGYKWEADGITLGAHLKF